MSDLWDYHSTHQPTQPLSDKSGGTVTAVTLNPISPRAATMTVVPPSSSVPTRPPPSKSSPSPSCTSTPAPSAPTPTISPESPWHIPHACGPRWVSENTCEFRVWAPHGEDVEVEFQAASSCKLLREGDFWRGEAVCEAGDKYRIVMASSWNDCFHAEGARLIRRDPCARDCEFDSNWCFVPPILPLRARGDYKVPKFNELVIYEVHLGSWVPEALPGATEPSSVFSRATEKLDYVHALGYNCIQLMPTAEFGGIYGYNSRVLLAAHGPYGTAKELREFVDRAHELGIAVLFDLVLNHGSAKMNSLWNYDGFGADNCGGIYFEGESDTPWGRRFSFHKAEVKDYLKQSCRVAIEEFGADGLRFDSVHNMPKWLLQELTHCIKEHYPEKILIAEVTPEDPAVITAQGFHSCWIHATHFDSLKFMFKFDGGENEYTRMKMLKGMACLHHGHYPNTVSGVHSVLGSHDQIGDRRDGNQGGRGKHRYYVHRLGGRDNWHARAQCRAWLAFQNCIKGLPMTFMGSETNQASWWHTDAHHRFAWEHDKLAEEMIAFVTASNKLRRSSSAFVNEEIKFVHEDAGNGVLAFMRWLEGAAFLCVVHLGEAQWENGDYAIGTGWGGDRKWCLALNSMAGEFGGWEGSCKEEVTADGSGTVWISLPKWSCVVYKSE